MMSRMLPYAGVVNYYPANSNILSGDASENPGLDICVELTKIRAMHEITKEPQNIIEDFVPRVISALARPMFSREIATFLGISPVIVGNALKVASGYGLASKVAPFNEKRQIWVRAEGDAYADALAAWEVRRKQRPIQPSQSLACETPTSSSINEDFWSRWLRNDPVTRPKLDD